MTPMERTASATAMPCAASTSTRRSLATISSGVCAFFLPIDEPSSASASHITGGPLLGGRSVTAPTTPTVQQRPRCPAIPIRSGRLPETRAQNRPERTKTSHTTRGTIPIMVIA